MNSYKSNDWSDLGLKKDVEQIKKKINVQEPIIYSIGIEIVIAVGAVLVDHFFDTETVPCGVWIGTSLLAIAPPLFFIIKALIKYIWRVFLSKRGILNVEKYIDSFDNSICYWTMMSCSFLDEIKSNKEISDEEKVFYYQEISYYANKVFYCLDEMSPIVGKVFSDKAECISFKKVISIDRLEIILYLLNRIYNETENIMNDVVQFNESIKKQRKINSRYKELLRSFLESIRSNYKLSFQWKD